MTYQIFVNNNGGATGQYSLKDTPLFDNDVTIHSGSFSGQANGPMNTVGSTTLANNVSIIAGATHIYNVTFTVTLNLDPGSPDGGNNIYTPCAVPGNGPGSNTGQGLYNRAELDRTGDGITDITDDACGDLPNITMVKNFVSVTPGQDESYRVTYQIIVHNNGGASGVYTLKDSPLFDNDVTIISWDYTFVDVLGGIGNGPAFFGSPPIPINLGTLNLTAGNTHIYTLSFNVTLNVTPGSPDPGDNIYTPCLVPGNGPGSNSGQGLYNRAELDRTGDGVTDITDDACGDLPGSIGDFVWEDKNANGLQDVGEPGIPNVLVRLYNQVGTQIDFKITDPNGLYLFKNLGPGIYRVRFDRPNGYEPTSKDKPGDDSKDSDADLLTGMTDLIFLGPGETNLTIDAGYYKLARLGDFVWEDRNSNGIQNPLEPGIPQVTVHLTGTDAFGVGVNQATVTNGIGFYEFINLVPGNYKVTFIKPGAAYKPSVADAPFDDTKDSDANQVNGESATVFLSSGENNNTIDAGFYRCANVGDYVWLDLGTQANMQDLGDIGLNGILVELYSTSNPGIPVQSMLTIDDPIKLGKGGYYNFEVCPVGDYFIKVRKTPDFDFVQPNQGFDDAIDSDIIDFINESTLVFTVTYAAFIDDIDAGLILRPLPVELSYFNGVWNQTRDVNELYWTTLYESNNAYFELERSFEGGDFKLIGKVDGKGNSTTKVDYKYDDIDISENGVYTYRLKQVDFDGKVNYSEAIDIKVDRKGNVKTLVYPNPSGSHVNIEIIGIEGAKVTVDIYDNIGKLVIKGLINDVMDKNVLISRIESGLLSEGVYFIMINIDGQITAHKLIIIE
ncbi:MAG: T9SS type A sorting domain-containing protein [Saprospiraceae bacterium]|nr:T9SS type A sorting domain-containing protein [Saprospiraceae bacterium]